MRTRKSWGAKEREVPVLVFGERGKDMTSEEWVDSFELARGGKMVVEWGQPWQPGDSALQVGRIRSREMGGSCTVIKIMRRTM